MHKQCDPVLKYSFIFFKKILLYNFFKRCSDQSELKRHTILRKMEMLPKVVKQARARVLSSLDE